jgi:hypothetical protein
MARVYIGTFPSGFDRVAIDPATFAPAAAQLDAEAAERRRQATEKIATAPRVKATRRARAARRLRSALKLFGVRT